LYENPANQDVGADCVPTGKTSVHHVTVHNIDAMKQFAAHFPNATELTLIESFNASRHSLLNTLRPSIPLEQLSKLTLRCHRIPFEQILELLHFTPNMHTLALDTILLYGINPLLSPKH
jgi:hypothetical protein